MRGQVIIAVLLVLLSGTFRFCPSCSMAEEQQKPASVHACCDKTMTDGVAAETAWPASPDRSTPAQDGSDDNRQGEDCARAAIGAILQAASLDLQPNDGSDAVVASVAVFLPFDGSVSPLVANSAIVIDSSPPLSLATPIRI